MSNNEPTFDPLNCSAEEEAEMLKGYLLAGSIGGRCPPLASMAFEHGYRMRKNDMNQVADEDQRNLAKRYLREVNRHPSP